MDIQGYKNREIAKKLSVSVSTIEKDLKKFKDEITSKLLVFPYIIDRKIGGHMKSKKNDKIFSKWNDVPKKHKNFWIEAAQEIKEITKWLK